MVVRILCLPGFSQNKSVFHKKFAAVEKYCGTSVEFVIMEPPLELKPTDIAGNAPTNFDSTADFDSPERIPRAWWRANEDLTIYYGAEESIKYMRDFLAHQTVPFDGVLGFSQGAAMAALTSALLEQPSRLNYFMIDGEPPHPPLRFSVYVSGFKPRDPKLVHLFDDEKLKTPSLHVLGHNDVIVGIARSQTLIDVCESSRVEWHDGGHFIPARLIWRQFFKNYFLSWDLSSSISPNNVPPPSPSVSSTTDSQPETPVTTRPDTRPPASGNSHL